MKQFEISHFLTQAQDVTQIARRIRDTILLDAPDDLLSRNVTYSAVPDEPLSIYAHVLHTRHILRLEYIKFTVPNGELAAARYIDFGLVGSEEIKGNVLVSIIAPNHLLLSNDESFQFPIGGDDSYHVGRARNAITQALLSSVISNLSKWTHGS